MARNKHDRRSTTKNNGTKRKQGVKSKNTPYRKNY
jgi:hypothetical protein